MQSNQKFKLKSTQKLRENGFDGAYASDIEIFQDQKLIIF